jgi:uncharacterized protein YeaO (DUF488 family)
VASRHQASIEVQRIYDPVPDDGSYRVLVDRLWPRGVTKSDAAVDEWAKDIAPSTDLRRWYGHDPARFREFARRYRKELEHTDVADHISEIRARARTRRVTLVTATRDVEHSGARVLSDVLSGDT